MRQVRGQFCRTAHRELAARQVHLLVYHLVPQKHTGVPYSLLRRRFSTKPSETALYNPSQPVILKARSRRLTIRSSHSE